MKMYRKSERNKSWAIAMIADNPETVTVEAVDSVTGIWLATLIVFHSNGVVERDTSVYACLDGEGYDPFEHGNRFDDDGRIIVD